MPEVLYPVAKTKEGGWLWIDDATPSIEAYCPECHARMVARLGDVRQHHFAHLSASATCSGESGIHAVGKHVLAYTLERIGVLSFQTTCSRTWEFCPASHCRSLFQHLPIDHVAIEEAIEGGLRPDLTIALKDGSKAYAEVVYKHPIPSGKWEHFVQEGSPVIVWRITGAHDLAAPPLTKTGRSIYHGHLALPTPGDNGSRPTLRIYTLREAHRTPECPTEEPIGIYYYMSECWKCSKLIRIALVPQETCDELGFVTGGGGIQESYNYVNAEGEDVSVYHSFPDRIVKWNWDFVKQVKEKAGITLKGAKTAIYGYRYYGLHTVCPHCSRIQGHGWVLNDLEHGEHHDTLQPVGLIRSLCGTP